MQTWKSALRTAHALPLVTKHPAESPQPGSSQIQALQTVPAPQKPKKLYLRVPARESREFLKAVNLIDIFEGNTQVVFYTMDEKGYFSYSRLIMASEFVLSELCQLLGRENVILK